MCEKSWKLINFLFILMSARFLPKKYHVHVFPTSLHAQVKMKS